jgi:hypothetical protein
MLKTTGTIQVIPFRQFISNVTSLKWYNGTCYNIKLYKLQINKNTPRGIFKKNKQNCFYYYYRVNCKLKILTFYILSGVPVCTFSVYTHNTMVHIYPGTCRPALLSATVHCVCVCVCVHCTTMVVYYRTGSKWRRGDAHAHVVCHVCVLHSTVYIYLNLQCSNAGHRGSQCLFQFLNIQSRYQ